jgi:hypothetical protein
MTDSCSSLLDLINLKVKVDFKQPLYIYFDMNISRA